MSAEQVREAELRDRVARERALMDQIHKLKTLSAPTPAGRRTQAKHAARSRQQQLALTDINHKHQSQAPGTQFSLAGIAQ